jgi:hypothetical protein
MILLADLANSSNNTSDDLPASIIWVIETTSSQLACQQHSRSFDADCIIHEQAEQVQDNLRKPDVAYHISVKKEWYGESGGGAVFAFLRHVL